MKIYIFPIFLISIICIAVFRVFMKTASNGFDEAIEEFKEKESKANFTIKKIEDLEIKYIYPNREILPFREYGDEKELRAVKKKQELAKRKCELEMIKLPVGLTNTEVKMEYGVNNFDKITLMEEHYNGYTRALFEWAKELYNIGNTEDCKIILQESVRLETDINQVYTLLSDIFLDEKNKQGLKELKEDVEKIEMHSKEKILQHINDNLQRIN